MIDQFDISESPGDASEPFSGPTEPEKDARSGSHLGRAAHEEESDHLRRVADELGGAYSSSIELYSSRLRSGDMDERLAAAAGLGVLGNRQAIAVLRGLLESADPMAWEIAVHGLRQSRDRAGWLCLESVALDLVDTLESVDEEPLHAFRLLVMGRTKTMDRLFRAADGHSRSLSAAAAQAFTRVAVHSVPGQMSEVMALRLGISSFQAGMSATPEQVSAITGLPVEKVRELEGLAWETVQRSRAYAEIRRNYEVNVDRLRTTD